jgi:hypothetical protein
VEKMPDSANDKDNIITIKKREGRCFERPEIPKAYDTFAAKQHAVKAT